MAGDWIKMRANLQTHPKVARIASASNADRLRVIGGLHAVWCLFDEHSADGQLRGYTPSAVDSLIGWPGFTDLLIGVGWLESDGNDGLTLPEFDTHNGASAKRRAQENDRKKAERAAAKDHPQPDLIPSAPHADKKRTREEKRREDTEAIASVGAKRSAKKCPDTFVVTDDMRAWAAKEASGVDVDRETAKMRDHTFATARTEWTATWRNWMREAFDRLKTKGGTVTAGRHTDSYEETQRLLAEQTKGAAAMPAQVRQLADRLKGRAVA